MVLFSCESWWLEAVVLVTKQCGSDTGRGIPVGVDHGKLRLAWRPWELEVTCQSLESFRSVNTLRKELLCTCSDSSSFVSAYACM